ncbi:MAG TPA: hypothetical protein VMY38_04835 [Gemmatimonadaceae bacterium]|nr:hypothetical protein [Gemmatimonadaceae bacterium]
MMGLGILLLLQAGAAAQPAPVSVPVRIGVRVNPDTVTVGDQFTVLVRVRAPAGSTIEFPANTDSAATVALAADPVIAEPKLIPSASAGPSTEMEQVAGYRMAAWDIGPQPLGLGEIMVRSGIAERRIPLASYTVFVRSVLPADTTLHVPKPARGPLAFAYPWWLKWLLIALGVLLALLLAWLAWRAYKRWKSRPVHPAAFAQREFHRIEKLGLPDKDEGALHVALMTDVMRNYLAARAEGVRPSQTSTELAIAARSSGLLDPQWAAGLGELLHQSDLAKFAAWRVDAAQARALGADARAVVDAVEARFAEQEKRKAA